METKILKACGIEWYCELRGSGPTIVLIPSGEGDCGSFGMVADTLAEDFTVLTFDMPGFSRSSTPADFEKVSARLLADQITELVTSWNFTPATFYGCSSGGQVVLSLVADHPDVVRGGIVHEAALAKDYAWPEMGAEWRAHLNGLDDAGIVHACKDLFRNQMNYYPQAWDALGESYHHRLEKNYITWVRRYLKAGVLDRSYNQEELSRRPIAWSIGGFSQVWQRIGDLRVAQRANIDVKIFKCRHFPQLEIPAVLANHIREHAKQQVGRERVASQRSVLSPTAIFEGRSR